MAGFIDGWSKYINIYDFFQFLLPGFVLLIGLSLILAGVSQPVFAKLVNDTLPENDWLLGGAVVIIAYVLGLLIAWPAQQLARLFYSRLASHAALYEPGRPLQTAWTGTVRQRITYEQAWVVLRESKDKKSYEFCYYLWGLEGMFRSLALSFMVLGAGFWFYELLPGKTDNVIVIAALLGLAALMLWAARGYYSRLLGDLTLSTQWKTKSDP